MCCPVNMMSKKFDPPSPRGASSNPKGFTKLFCLEKFWKFNSEG